jgi:uncharacterized phosphosugar-binding protein
MSLSGDGRPDAGATAALVRDTYAGRIAALDAAQIAPVAAALAQRLGADGLLHVVGCGHSQLVALEGFHRAGSPAWVAPLLHDRVSPAHGALSTAAEDQPGLGAELAGRLSDPTARARALLVVSASGRTAVPLEAARVGRALGLLTIALTARRDGNPLAASVDHVIVSGVPSTDAAVEVGGVLMAPQSTVLGVVLLHALLAETEALRADGAVVLSTKLDGAAAHNRALTRRYPHLGTL